MKYLLLCILCLPLMVLAAENVGEGDEQYIDIGQWHVSLALGVGVKTNPLVDGDNIPLVLVPDIAYYGESFYFDNGDLGFTWLDEPKYSVSILLRLNTERAYFSFWHPANILLNATSADSVTDGATPGEDQTSLSIDEVAKREFALDAGVQGLWYFEYGGRLAIQWFNDISGVYKGHHGAVSFAQTFDGQNSKWLATIGVNYKSADLVDYYYGISQRDDVHHSFYYQAKTSVSPFIKLDMRYPLTEKWQGLSFIRIEKLASGMSHSPLVDKSYAATGFVGVSYAF